jgi:hypothetical protein
MPMMPSTDRSGVGTEVVESVLVADAALTDLSYGLPDIEGEAGENVSVR